MVELVRFAAPRSVEVVTQESGPLQPGQVRVRTLFSGISAGTELTAYRGTNPYLTSQWDPSLRLFTDTAAASTTYPLDGWGYSESGVVTEVGSELGTDDDDAKIADRLPRIGETVWGIWGHRSEGVLDGEALRGHVIPASVDPLSATFVRVGAIALNAVLAADLSVGSTVVIVGQGVIGLLATSLAVSAGATVIVVDGIERRREEAIRRGASAAYAPSDDVARITRGQFAGGVDVVIEFSGTYGGLQSATRIAGMDGTVVAAGFYQGGGEALRLGDEFHHNRIQILASQIGSIPNRLRARWSVQRLQRVIIDELASGRLEVTSLVTHRHGVDDVAEAYRLIDENAAAALQTVIEFGA